MGTTTGELFKKRRNGDALIARVRRLQSPAAEYFPAAACGDFPAHEVSASVPASALTFPLLVTMSDAFRLLRGDTFQRRGAKQPAVFSAASFRARLRSAGVLPVRRSRPVCIRGGNIESRGAVLFRRDDILRAFFS